VARVAPEVPPRDVSSELDFQGPEPGAVAPAVDPSAGPAVRARPEGEGNTGPDLGTVAGDLGRGDYELGSDAPYIFGTLWHR
jgi:hypothetical protein